MQWQLQILITGVVIVTLVFLLSFASSRILPLLRREQIYRDALAFFWQAWATHRQYLAHLQAVRVSAKDVKGLRDQLQTTFSDFIATEAGGMKKAILDQQIRNIQALITRLQTYMDNLLGAGSKVFENAPNIKEQSQIFAAGCMYGAKDVIDEYRDIYLPQLAKISEASNAISNDIAKNGVESGDMDRLLGIYSSELDKFQIIMFDKMVPVARDAAQRSHVTMVFVWLIDKMASLFERKM